MKKVLIINAHQKYEGVAEGKLNHTLVDAITKTIEKNGGVVKTTYVEKGYTPSEEVEKHEWADWVILQTPSYWFNTPWIFKKYIDEVFNTAIFSGKLVKDDGRTRSNPGKQYGTGGLSQGKKFMLSVTWNAPKEAFDNVNQYLLEGKSADDVFLNITSNYKFCGFKILKGYHACNVVKSPQIEQYKKELSQHIQTFINK